MGLRLRRSEVEEAAGAQNPALEARIGDLEALLTSVECFIEDRRLRGRGWSSAKEYARLVFVPLVRGLIETAEQLRAANGKVVSGLGEHISEEQLDEDGLRAHLGNLRRQREQVRLLRERKYYGMNMSSVHDIEVDSAIVREIRAVEEQLRHLHAFAAQVKGVYDVARRSADRVGDGLARVGSHRPGRVSGGRFSVGGLDLGWIEAINVAWDEGDGAYHRRMIAGLLGYDVYVVFEVDGRGRLGVRWQLERDGVGVANEELYAYLREYGLGLGPSVVRVISWEDWDSRVRRLRRQGVDYATGGDIGWFPAAGQRVVDGLGWLEETGLADLLGLVPAVGLVPRTVRGLMAAARLARLGEENGPKVAISGRPTLPVSGEVQSLAERVHERFGGKFEPADGPGRIITIPNGARGKKHPEGDKEIRIRIMDPTLGGTRDKPYYRITVGPQGSVNRRGERSSDRKNTHVILDDGSFEEISDIVNKWLEK